MSALDAGTLASVELSDLAGEKYVSITTYRANGESSARPVWIAALDDGRLGFTTDATSLKVRRIRNDGRVRLQPCDVRGNVRPRTAPLDARAVITAEGEADWTRVRSAIARKYGLQFRLITGMGRLRRLIGRSPSGGCAVVISERE